MSGTTRTSASRMPWTFSQVAIWAIFRSWVRPDNISSPMTASPAVQIRCKSLPPFDIRPLLSYLRHMTEYIHVGPEDRAEPRSHVIKLHGPEGFEGMRRAGKLAASILDALVPHVVPGVTTSEID